MVVKSQTKRNISYRKFFNIFLAGFVSLFSGCSYCSFGIKRDLPVKNPQFVVYARFNRVEQFKGKGVPTNSRLEINIWDYKTRKCLIYIHRKIAIEYLDAVYTLKGQILTVDIWDKSHLENKWHFEFVQDQKSGKFHLARESGVFVK